jgi:hypothetical protein
VDLAAGVQVAPVDDQASDGASLAGLERPIPRSPGKVPSIRARIDSGVTSGLIAAGTGRAG